MPDPDEIGSGSGAADGADEVEAQPGQMPESTNTEVNA